MGTAADPAPAPVPIVAAAAEVGIAPMPSAIPSSHSELELWTSVRSSRSRLESRSAGGGRLTAPLLVPEGWEEEEGKVRVGRLGGYCDEFCVSLVEEEE